MSLNDPLLRNDELNNINSDNLHGNNNGIDQDDDDDNERANNSIAIDPINVNDHEMNNDENDGLRLRRNILQQQGQHSTTTSSSNDNNNINNRRLLDRDAAFYQSRGRWQIQHQHPTNNRRRDILSNSSTNDDVNNDNPSPNPNPNNSCENTPNDNSNHSSSSSTCFQRQQPIVSNSISKYIWDNWFYNLAYQRTVVLMLIIFTIYTIIIFLFALFYLLVSKYGRMLNTNAITGPINNNTFTNITNTSNDIAKVNDNIPSLYYCDMDITTHMEALYFSLSTMTTIGYGVSDYYFGGCYIPFVLVLIQVCCSITFNAVAASILFLRFSRGNKRMKTILFSNTATICRINGVPYLMFRVGEIRQNQLFNASIQSYCIRTERQFVQQPTTIRQYMHNHLCNSSNDNGIAIMQQQQCDDEERNDHPPRNPDNNNNQNNNRNHIIQSTHFVTKPMQLQHEAIGSSSSNNNNILMSLPQVLVHRMDELSPLLPSLSSSSCYNCSPQEHEQENAVWYDKHGTAHQSSLCYNIYNADNTIRQRQHSPTSTTTSNISSSLHHQQQQSELHQHEYYTKQTIECQKFFVDRNIEIVVLLEGADELTGAIIQARHSYTYDDIQWDHTFVPCVFPYDDYNDLDNDNTDTTYNDTDNNEQRELSTTTTMIDNSSGRTMFSRLCCYFEKQRQQQQRNNNYNTTNNRLGRRRRIREKRKQPVCVIDFGRFHETESVPMNNHSCPYIF